MEQTHRLAVTIHTVENILEGYPCYCAGSSGRRKTQFPELCVSKCAYTSASQSAALV